MDVRLTDLVASQVIAHVLTMTRRENEADRAFTVNNSSLESAAVARRFFPRSHAITVVRFDKAERGQSVAAPEANLKQRREALYKFKTIKPSVTTLSLNA